MYLLPKYSDIVKFYVHNPDFMKWYTGVRKLFRHASEGIFSILTIWKIPKTGYSCISLFTSIEIQAGKNDKYFKTMLNKDNVS